VGLVFVAMIDAPLKGILEKFKVKIRAIQDDMTMMGDPEQTFGRDKALESLLELLAKVNLSPSRAKFQCIGTTDDALDNAPDWLIFDKSPVCFSHYAICLISPPLGARKK
jgi:hypothetical protein